MTLPFLLAGASRGDDSQPRRHVDTAARWLLVRADEPAAMADGEERNLVERLRAADEGAFRELWDRYHARLADFALRYLGSRDAAADVVQDVFIALWERHEHLDIRGSVAGYLYGMVRHTAMDARKHEHVVHRHEELMAARYVEAPVVARNLGVDAVVVEELQQILRRVVHSFPPRMREIFLMSREDGLAPSVIAATLRIRPQVVYNQLSRALAALSEALARES